MAETRTTGSWASTFADIAELPTLTGPVARWSHHRPDDPPTMRSGGRSGSWNRTGADIAALPALAGPKPDYTPAEGSWDRTAAAIFTLPVAEPKRTVAEPGTYAVVRLGYTNPTRNMGLGRTTGVGRLDGAPRPTIARTPDSGWQPRKQTPVRVPRHKLFTVLGRLDAVGWNKPEWASEAAIARKYLVSAANDTPLEDEAISFMAPTGAEVWLLASMPDEDGDDYLASL